MVGSKVIALSKRHSSHARLDLIIAEYRFLTHSMEKAIRKFQKKFDRDPTVGSKVMALANRPSSLARPDLKTSSIDSSSTPWKRASVNSKKNLIAIQRLDRKLWPLRPVHPACSTRPHHHRVSIPHLLHGKEHPETPIKD